MAHVEGFENAFPNPLFQPGKRHELWEYSFDVIRLFQNTVASGQSFLDHCRSTVRRRYRNEQFLAEFKDYFAACIEGSPVCMFVKELRNFLLHQESVSPTVSRSVIDFPDPWKSMRRERELNQQILAEGDTLHTELVTLLDSIHVEELQVFRRGAQLQSWFAEGDSRGSRSARKER